MLLLPFGEKNHCQSPVSVVAQGTTCLASCCSESYVVGTTSWLKLAMKEPAVTALEMLGVLRAGAVSDAVGGAMLTEVFTETCLEELTLLRYHRLPNTHRT
jgi:hypothetical protein